MTKAQSYALRVGLLRSIPMPTDNGEQQVEILLVEDSDDDAELMRDALQAGSLSLHVTWVDNGEEAMEYLRQQGKHAAAPEPNLILLDLFLPRMNGHEVLEEIRQDALLRRIPIVIMTGSDNAEAIQRAYDLYANCCVAKPTDQQEFALAVKKIEQFWLQNAYRK